MKNLLSFCLAPAKNWLALFVFLAGLGAALAPTGAWAQPIVKPAITVAPSPVAVNGTVTIRVDVAGTVWEAADLYLWAFLSPGGDAPANGQWAESSEAARFTNVGGSVYEKTFKVDEYYAKTAAAFKLAQNKFGFLVKLKNGNNGKTEDQFASVDPPKFILQIVRMFPSTATQEDAITFFYKPGNEPEGTATEIKGQTDLFAFIGTAILDGTTEGDLIAPVGFDQVPGNAAVKMKAGTNGDFYITIYPKKYFNLQPGQKISRIFIKVRSADGTKNYPATADAPTKDNTLGFRLLGI